MSDISIAHEVLGRLGKASHFMDRDESKTAVPQACEVIKETLRRGAQGLIADAAGRPILTSKSCDGTPITVTHHKTYNQPGGKRVKKVGKQGVEFLVANQFVRSDIGVGGAMLTKVILGEATPLEHGKTVPAILLACRQHWHRLRDLGHMGCAIEHYCWDRMGIVALETQTRQWHAEQPLPPLPPGAEPEIVKLTEFVCVTACALHDSHNSLKWAMGSSFSDKELVRDIFIGFESLKRSSDLLSKFIYEWLHSVLQPHQDRGASWVEARMVLWDDLGVDPLTAELLAKQLQLVWDGKRLMFLKGAFADGDLPQAVASALMGAWHFKSWSESRWLTCGAGCRTMIAAFLTGVQGLARLIMKESTTIFFLRGLDRVKERHLEFMATCAMASRLPEALQLAMMKDNRVAQTADSLWEEAAKMMKWAINVSDDTYALLGQLCKRPGSAIKDACINAAQISFHFFYRRVLVRAGELPWRLVRGDIAHNLEDLAAGVCPEEPVSKNLWLLMHRPFPKAQLIKTVELLGEVPWTSLPAEQQHSSLAMLRKWHPEYAVNTLISRALLLQAFKLLPTQSKAEKLAERLSGRLQNILRAQPEKISGRQMLVASMIRICTGKRELGQAGHGVSGYTIANRCISRHGAFWARQSLAQQAEWNGLARRHAHAKRHLLSIEWDVIGAELKKVEAECKEDKHPPLTMKSAALDEQDISTFDRLYSQPGFNTPAAIAERRAGVGHAPRYFRQQMGGPDVWRHEEPNMPQWAKPLVQFRNMFCGSALVVRRDGGARDFYKMVFAVKSPKEYLALCPLHPVPAPSVDDLATAQEPLGPDFVFAINYADCISAADVVVGARDHLSCLFRLVHEGGTRVTSDMQPLALEYVLEGTDCDLGPVELVETQTEGATASGDPTFEKLVTTTLPWLQFLDYKQGFTAEGPAGSEAVEAENAVIDEDEVWEGLARLERARAAEVEVAAALPDRDFVSKVRGGESEVYRSGDIVHAMQGQCSGAEATAWARMHGASTFKATVSEHGVEEAKILVRSWCHRMQYFYNLEMSAAPSSDFSFAPAVVEAYGEPTELAALAGMVGHPKWQKWIKRIEAIRRIPRV